ncbi:hypothetical protein PUR71_04230 [Streptomyces sp. SP17BM10]|uniref:hypothetical protein n=1 Tax=Streptomyces sp. SP17BM10 TaxID=3002530 RepID=UPI002E789E9B|nr:hypothetical protein [Streptomyces sp. SP17BM10]MEE1782139.1 hypothetical protein [Streptomyces sp. SP17BM10]
MLKVRALALAAVAAGSLVVGVGAAAPASARTTDVCDVWSDGNTFGTSCGRSDVAIVFRAKALCNNGQIVYGAWKATGGGSWSYAYCTSVNSTVASGGWQFA